MVASTTTTIASSFNPRSPPKRGATLGLSTSNATELFQSTLPSEERSDRARLRRTRFPNSFNPRSPPKRGAT